MAALFSAGVLGTLMLSSLHSHLKQGSPLPDTPGYRKGKRRKAASDVISLKALEEVFRSSDPQLQESALQILLDRAMTEQSLSYIIKCCKNSKIPVTQRRAVAVIQQLTKQEQNRVILVRRGILKIFCHILLQPADETTYRYCIISMFRLVQNKDQRKVQIVRYGILGPLKKFLSISSTHSNDLMYWSLLLTHQLSLIDELQSELIGTGFLYILAYMIRLTFGNASMQRLCLHSLVRLLSKMENTEVVKQLQSLLQVNIVPLLVTCLRNEDVELASWAVFLIHEFVTKDVAKENFQSMKGLLPALAALLNSEEACVPRLVLRSLKYLGMRNDQYQIEMIRAGVVSKIVPCLIGGEHSDPDSPLWALALLHDLLAHAEAHAQFLEAKGLDTLIRISYDTTVHLSLYIADIIVYLASSLQNRDMLENSEVLDAVLHFCKSDEAELQYAGAALLLNLATLSDKMTDRIAENGSIELLADLTLHSDRENIQTVASKTLTTLTRRDPLLRDLIIATAIRPLVALVIEEAARTVHILFPRSSKRQSASDTFRGARGDGCVTIQSFELGTSCEPEADRLSIGEQSGYPEVFERLTGQLISLTIFMESELFDMPPRKKLERLLTTLLDLLILPLMYAEEEDTRSVDSDVQILTQTSSQIDALKCAKLGPDTDENGAPVAQGFAPGFGNFKDEVAMHALKLVAKLLKNDDACEYLVQENVFTVMVALMQQNRPNVSEQAIVALSAASLLPGLRNVILDVPFAFTGLTRALLRNASPMLRFHIQSFYEAVCNYTEPELRSSLEGDNVKFTKSQATPYMLVSPQCWEIRNESWTFESVRSEFGVIGSGRCAYEVELHTDGIVQIGWASSLCTFDPEAGTGVGDNRYSYAYDGHRKKKWHGPCSQSNEYGDDWYEWDVITALIDLDNKEISYLRNGVSLGVAFVDIPDVTWYPAISLASAQGCRVRFGYQLDPLQYLPQGYASIASIACNDAEVLSPDAPSVYYDASESPSNEDPLGISNLSVPLTEPTSCDRHEFLPSAYFELQLGIGGPETFMIPQVGIADRDKNIFFVGLCPGGRYVLMVVRNRDPDDKTFFRKDINEMLMHESMATIQDTEILATWRGPPVQDGDVIGCAISFAQGALLFTLNGKELGPIVHGVSEKLYVPYIRYVPRFTLNLGKASFLWPFGVPFGIGRLL
ncbi:uncharacterized protein SPPG_08568 [Spizellomyces punctatus DAOM BR117]|uniref:B30.2/SPRY domain-containing protein n=1 Tax=Spizellomyces punctatus (strain DAOM BR117) TaxID=645134 RepID=A0A0L0H5G2_SPIPD|nr:uncharacterized protein SPPG_08568 [Spizellomyces punctatus DAOM BR117]KNC95963.1 hypothetical protein SPPG_08568 [Spizellomyces punctatus DAOM BR117]|eukprot:XP_016604003.1 hypothetical protein SPPG_08568 [Spizellomyces punctatus DAOM BR117]